MEPRTISCKFIGYSDKSKGYKFYCLNSLTRIQETHNAKFIESVKVVHFCTDALVFEELNEQPSESSHQATTIIFSPTMTDGTTENDL